jgi:tRNA-dihydrouridine synthase B
MIGRGAQGNPWIFREIAHFLATGRPARPPTAAEVHQVMQQHLRALHHFYGERQGVRVARKHIGWYLNGRPGGKALRRRLMGVERPEEQLGLLRAHFLDREALAA